MFTLFTNDGQLTVGPNAPELPSVSVYFGCDTPSKAAFSNNIIRLSTQGVMIALPCDSESNKSLLTSLENIKNYIAKTIEAEGPHRVEHPAALIVVPEIGTCAVRQDMLLHYEIDLADMEVAVRHNVVDGCKICSLILKHPKTAIRMNFFSQCPASYDTVLALIAELTTASEVLP